MFKGKNIRKYFFLPFFVIFTIVMLSYFSPAVYAADIADIPEIAAPGMTVPGGFKFSFSPTDDPTQIAASLQLLFIMSIIALAPSLLIMLTCFTRLIISFHFLRAAMGTQSMPPNQVLIGLALFLTFFLMGDIFIEINEYALQPFSAGVITQEEALERGTQPLRDFMLRQAESGDVALFARLSGTELATEEDILNMPMSILIPAFILGELTKGFSIGFAIFIPFLVIDMVVASVLMAMGMMMLPPAMISMPFKLLLFIMVDGWGMFIEQVILTFR